MYREWAPNAIEASLVGDFSMSYCRDPWLKRCSLRLADSWDVAATPMSRNVFGVWDVTVPAKDGVPAIPHNSCIKVRS